MRSVKATAHANIAVVKYWGKADLEQNLPSAPSVSVTLEALTTETTVSFDASLTVDSLILDGKKASENATDRVSEFLEGFRFRHGFRTFARVETRNNFPTAAGLASSASGFAALAIAATHAAEIELNAAEISSLARRGSGSAARSIFGGFVKMNTGTDAYAEQIADASHWDLTCLICLTERGPKKIGSTEAMESTKFSSPFFDAWIDDAKRDTPLAVEAILEKDFSALVMIAQRSCLRMHACAMAADPGIIYWKAATLTLIEAVREIQETIPCFFTIDAGPHVKVFCHTADAQRLKLELELTDVIGTMIVSRVGGAPKVDVVG